MPKSKKPRKKRKPQPPKAKVLTKTPYCKHCNTVCRLATDAELKDIKWADPSFTMDFLFLPQCNCWEEHDEWMML